MRIRRELGFLLISLILISIIPVKLKGQSHYVDGLYWLRVQTQFIFSPKWSGSLELEERRFLAPDRAHQRVFPDLRLFYHFTPSWKTGIGYTNFSISGPGTADIPVNQVLHEQRYALFLARKFKWEQKSLATQWKSELRNFDRDPLDGELNFLDYVIRLRFLAKYSYAINQRWKLSAGDELHINVAGNTDYQFFDQNRVFGGLSYNHQDFSYGLDYIFWYQKNRRGSAFFHRHILRFTFQYQFDFSGL